MDYQKLLVSMKEQKKIFFVALCNQCIFYEGLQHMYDHDFVLIHDGASCHRSHSTQIYLERNKICYICDWPLQSPDFNVIETIWSLLKASISTRFPKTSDELWKDAKEELYRIDDTYITHIIQRQLDTVIKMKGHNSKY